MTRHRQKAAMMLIDPQNGFIMDSLKELPVPGGDEAMNNAAKCIQDNIGYWEKVVLTMDCHQYWHIAHQISWIDKDGKHPDPMTVISPNDHYLKGGRWRYNSTDNDDQERSYNYLKSLEKGARYVLTIWPYHCIIGTEGNNIWAPINEAVKEWSLKSKLTPNYVPKGSNIWTEHYSAMKSAVPDPDDPTTEIDSYFIRDIQKYDIIYLGGLALNFCVANTILDIIEHFNPDDVKKMVLLEDCTQAISGADFLDQMTQDFLDKATAAGMQLGKSTNI